LVAVSVPSVGCVVQQLFQGEPVRGANGHVPGQRDIGDHAGAFPIALGHRAGGIAERHHHGEVGIDSEVGRGTRVVVRLKARAAELARERVARVVFADALALLDGEALPDIVKRPTAVNTELTSGPSRQDFETRLFADLEPAMRRWALERCTMHPIAAMQAPVRLERFWNEAWNASVIWCKRSTNPPQAHQRRTADRLKGRWHELDTGHYPMLTEPEALARLIADG
jgi:pimeloyl-ACP methyl ester carboxylesterase